MLIIFHPLLLNFQKSSFRNVKRYFPDFGIAINWSSESKSSSSAPSTNGSGAITDSSESDREDGCTNSPRMQRRRKRRIKSRGRSAQSEKSGHSGQSSGDGDAEDLSYVDTLPEVRLLITQGFMASYAKIKESRGTQSIHSS